MTRAEQRSLRPKVYNPRLFFALQPPAATRAALAEVRDRLTTPGTRPVATINLHLTLVFLGAIGAERQARALEIAAALTPPPAFELLLDHLGGWPGPAVRWCAPRIVPVELERLVAALHLALTAEGFALDSRPYRPHITLIRSAPALRSMRLEPPLRWSVTQFALLASQPGQRPAYAALGEWPLAPLSPVGTAAGQP